MKKNFLLFILVILGSIIFAQEIQWIVTEDTQLNLYSNNGLKEIKRGTEICPQKHTSYEYQTDSITYINFNGARGDINSNVVIPKNSNELFNDKLINFYAAILPYYNFDILQKKIELY